MFIAIKHMDFFIAAAKWVLPTYYMAERAYHMH